MAKIQNETAYKAAMERIEELLPLVDDNTPLNDKNLIELDLLSELVADYEEEHYPIKSPSLVDVIKLRMYEMGLNQAKLSELLGDKVPCSIQQILRSPLSPHQLILLSTIRN